MQKKQFLSLLMAAAVLVLLLSCSSAPKKAPQIYTIRNEAGRLVQMGAKALRDGQDGSAKEYYSEAYRMYTAVDDAEGRIRALDGLGRVSEGGLERWIQAERIADQTADPELVALASLLLAEHDLHAGNSEQAAASAARAASMLQKKADDRARALRIQGAALRNTGRYQEALGVLEAAAALDKKNNAFIEYASDMYLLATVLSRQGRYDAASKALYEALDYDRRAENPGGIGSNYAALGLVAEKAGNTDKAKQYYLKAFEVYTAARLNNRALEAEALYNALF